MADTPLTADTRVANRYRLVRLIARSAMAEVWEAFDEVLSRAIAVKALLPHLAGDEVFRERFKREAIAAARLSHPNIVATFDTGVDQSVWFIVMELVRGRTLRDELARGAALPVSRAVHIAAQVAQALEHAHAAGLVHRDVKPANILLAGGRDDVKVADFGIAKAAWDGAAHTADLTLPGVLVGTAKYVSPEQARGEEPDHRSDIYSLGVVLYEMLCGRPPHSADTDLATAYAHAHDAPSRPRELRAGLPRALDNVVMRAMAKDPAERYQSAAALREAVVGALPASDDAVPLGVAPPTPPRGVPVGFRHSERSWLASAFVIVLVAAAVVVAAVAFSQSDVGRGFVDQVRRRPEPLTIVEAHSFDPGGDGSEDENEVGALFDGDPATKWSSDRYNNRAFGNLKEGVGVWVRVEATSSLRSLAVDSDAGGWSAAVHVADGAGRDLGAWGQPVATVANAGGDVTIDLAGRDGTHVLLWFTQLGESNRVTINELVLSGG